MRLFLWVSVVTGAVLGALRWSVSEEVLVDTRSAFNERIVVSEDGHGVRRLRFSDGSIQTAMRVDDPLTLISPYYRVIADEMSRRVIDAPRVLVIGLGGGALPRWIHASNLLATVDAVEIDPVVVSVARRYFGFNEDARLRAFVADGFDFVAECDGAYDLILLDAYGATSDSVPVRLTTAPFFRALARCVAPGGVLMANVPGSQADELDYRMASAFKRVVTDNAVPGRSNRVLVVSR